MAREIQNFFLWTLRRRYANLALEPIRLASRTARLLATRATRSRARGTSSSVVEIDRDACAHCSSLPAIEIDEIVAFSRRHCVTAIARVVAEADGVLQGWFQLPGGRRFARNASSWTAPDADQESTFALNRWYFGLTLAKAYAYRRDVSYLEEFERLLLDWWDVNNGSDGPAWESYSVSERIANWILALRIFSAAGADQSRLSLLAVCLPAHAARLRSNLETADPHNHLINNARALFLYGVAMPALDGARQSRAIGWQLLQQELRRQFDSNGALREQSSHYHLLLLRTYCEVLLAASACGLAIPAWMNEKLEQMFLFADALVRPDGTIPLIGDCSPDLGVEALVGVVAVGARHFGLPVHSALSEYALWLGGSLTDPVRRAPDHALLHFRESGLAVYRSPSMHVALRCEYGVAVRRHGHDDALSLDVWHKGRAILSDSGNSTYQNDVWEEFFRGPWSHSTIVVDGLPARLRRRYHRALFGDDYLSADGGIVDCRARPRGAELAAMHTAYHRLASPVRLERAVVVQDDEWLLIEDNICASGYHRIQILFQLGDLELDGTVIVGPEGPIGQLIVRADVPVGIAAVRGVCQPFPSGWSSSEYWCRRPSTTIVVSLEGTGNRTVETLLWLRSGPARWPVRNKTAA